MNFLRMLGSVVHMTQGPDGALYYVLIGESQVRKIQFGSGNNSTPVVKSTSSAHELDLYRSQ